MTYYGLTARNSSTYDLPALNTGFLTQENGDYILQENGDKIFIENPTNDPSLTARNSSSYVLPNRN
jgi:flagellar basal body rod protein FlgG